MSVAELSRIRTFLIGHRPSILAGEVIEPQRGIELLRNLKIDAVFLPFERHAAIYRFDADSEQVTRALNGKVLGRLSGGFWIAPQIHLHPLAAALPAEASVRIQAKSGSMPLSNARISLMLKRGANLGGNSPPSRLETSHSDARGQATISFRPNEEVQGVMVSPRAGAWCMASKVQLGKTTVVTCPDLTMPADHLGWWHRRLLSPKWLSNSNRGTGIKIGVIDTGLGDHPWLEHVERLGSFKGTEILRGNMEDEFGHGTHVTGMIAARPADKVGYVGIAPGATVYAAKVFHSYSEGATDFDVSQAILAMIEKGVDIINLSLGCGATSPTLRDHISRANRRGIICIAAAGNSQEDVYVPARFRHCIAVTAYGMEDECPTNSLAGGYLQHGDHSNVFRTPPRPTQLEGPLPANFNCTGSHVNYIAPGVGIISTAVPQYVSEGLHPWREMSGTSMAAPALASALACHLSISQKYLDIPKTGDDARKRYYLARKVLHGICSSLEFHTHIEGDGSPKP